MKNKNPTIRLKADNQMGITYSKYCGKYIIDHFKITDTFIVNYMNVIEGIDIPESWLSGFSATIDIDSRKVMYMECSDIITKDVMSRLRKMVKCPPSHVRIYQNNKQIIKIETMESKNEKNI